ncbi:MAG TPA: hypothetical protein VKX45_19640 [Bryobacteraceae bacterium]|nr:hypothetical protein [Bryobacteraceae bacterium]
MTRFWNDALAILDTASRAPEAGAANGLAVVVERSGGLRIVMGEGWSAEGLQAHFGASAVYQVTHSPRSVCVEGRGPGESCTLRRSVVGQVHGLPYALLS